MAEFRILKGKALSSAIRSVGKAAATFSQAQHEVAYGALLHFAEHDGPEHMTAVYAAMPGNYKGMIREWFAAFGNGRVRFDVESSAFVVVKSVKADVNLEGARAVSPAEFQKEKRAGGAEKQVTEVSILEAALRKLQKLESCDARAIRAIEGALKTLTTPVVAIDNAPAKAKPVKAKAAPEAVEAAPAGQEAAAA